MNRTTVGMHSLAYWGVGFHDLNRQIYTTKWLYKSEPEQHRWGGRDLTVPYYLGVLYIFSKIPPCTQKTHKSTFSALSPSLKSRYKGLL